jgi:hypothetical protein
LYPLQFKEDFMLRILLIFSLIGYVLYKFGFFRAFTQEVRGQNPYQSVNRKAPNSNVNVDAAPPKEKRNGKFGGGEYVDYEEVK